MKKYIDYGNCPCDNTYTYGTRHFRRVIKTTLDDWCEGAIIATTCVKFTQQKRMKTMVSRLVIVIVLLAGLLAFVGMSVMAFWDVPVATQAIEKPLENGSK